MLVSKKKKGEGVDESRVGLRGLVDTRDLPFGRPRDATVGGPTGHARGHATGPGEVGGRHGAFLAEDDHTPVSTVSPRPVGEGRSVVGTHIRGPAGARGVDIDSGNDPYHGRHHFTPLYTPVVQITFFSDTRYN